MDPRDINPARTQEELVRLSDRLERAIGQAGEWARKAAAADVAYKVAYATALLDCEGTVAEREAIALIATQDLYRQKRHAEATLFAAQEAGRNIRSQLDAIRSVNSNLRPLVEAG